METVANILRVIWLLAPALAILGKSLGTGHGDWHKITVRDISEKIRHDRMAKSRWNYQDTAPGNEIFGMSVEYESPKKLNSFREGGKLVILEESKVFLRLFGNFNKSDEGAIFFTRVNSSKAGACDEQHSTPHHKVIFMDATMAYVPMQLPSKVDIPDTGYLCYKRNDDDPVLQGPKDWLTVQLATKLLPLWLQILFIVFLLCLSGLFSGLNLGLMSLNKTDLKIIINTGTSFERKYAAKIAPVRNHGNFLLCCLLFSNVLVNATLTILMDDITSGEVAIIMSTIVIVIFGEIVPQAICSRHGLAVGAKTIYITRFFMLITFPLAYPLSKILDKVLGEEIGSVYTRERLKELLKVTKDHHGLETEEVGIISGALEMKTKTVKDVMTKLNDVFMLSIDAILNFDTMAEIEYHGYSRIPVYDGERNNVVALLNVKQLTLLDPSDNIPLRTVIEYHRNELFFVDDHHRLDYMFRVFREGNRGHMAFVQTVVDDGPGDPYYETIGIVTMEDVLEELLQADIMDESDVGKSAGRKPHSQRPKNIPFMLHMKSKPVVEIPPSLAVAAVQFMSLLEPFSKDFISVNILQRLVRTCTAYLKMSKSRNPADLKDTYIYEKNKPCDFFVMILEGRVEVCVGVEQMTYEGGPFTTFGGDFLVANRDTTDESKGTSNIAKNRPTYLPDYTVRPLTDVTYFRLKLPTYKAAIIASGLEKKYKDSVKGAITGDWENEIEKVLNEAEDEQEALTS